VAWLTVAAVAVAAVAVGCGRLGFDPAQDRPISDARVGDGRVIDPSQIPDASTVACGGFDLDQCRREAGCTPVVCDCPCDTPVMRGCVGRGSNTLADCPMPDTCTGCCTVETLCGGAQYCLAPDESTQCGVCLSIDNPCFSDGDCAGTGQECDPVACGCGERECLDPPPCTLDTDCGPSRDCDTVAGRCRPRVCAGNDQCPADFICDATFCVRKSCAAEADCNGHHCVSGRCYSARGTCSFQPN